MAPYILALLAAGCDQATPNKPSEPLFKITRGPDTPPFVYCITVDDPQRKLHSRYCDFTVNKQGLDEIYMEEEIDGKMFYGTFKLGELSSVRRQERNGRPHIIVTLERNSKVAQDFIDDYEYYKKFLPKN